MEPTRLQVEIWRGAASGRFQTFSVPRREHQTILDVVTEIQREQDPTLAYRFACRVGMCGSCAMVVNGRPRWTCRTRVRDAVGADGTLRLEPLRNFTVVKDLAVEMTGFFDKWRDAKGHFEPARHRRRTSRWCRPPVRSGRPPTPASSASVAASAIPPAMWSPGTRTISGPAALNRAWTLVNDVRDHGNAARVKAVSGDSGCVSCHTHMSCTQFCPKGIAPTYSIAGLEARGDGRRVAGAVMIGTCRIGAACSVPPPLAGEGGEQRSWSRVGGLHSSNGDPLPALARGPLPARGGAP